MQDLGPLLLALLLGLASALLLLQLRALVRREQHLLLSTSLDALRLDARLHRVVGRDEEGLVKACTQVINYLRRQLASPTLRVLLVRVDTVNELKHRGEDGACARVVLLALGLALKQMQCHLEEEEHVRYLVLGDTYVQHHLAGEEGAATEQPREALGLGRAQQIGKVLD